MTSLTEIMIRIDLDDTRKDVSSQPMCVLVVCSPYSMYGGERPFPPGATQRQVEGAAEYVYGLLARVACQALNHIDYGIVGDKRFYYADDGDEDAPRLRNPDHNATGREVFCMWTGAPRMTLLYAACMYIRVSVSEVEEWAGLVGGRLADFRATQP